MSLIPCSTGHACGCCLFTGRMTVLDSGESFQAKLTSDLDDVVSVRTAAAPPVGSAVQIECRDLTVLGEIVAWTEGAVAQVRVEHVLNAAALERHAFNGAARHATASAQG